MNRFLKKLLLLSGLLLFLSEAVQASVMWGPPAANIPIGGASSILIILSLLAGGYLLPKVKTRTLKSIIALAMASGISYFGLQLQVISEVNALVPPTCNISITTQSGSEDILNDCQGSVTNNFGSKVRIISIEPNDQNCMLIAANTTCQAGTELNPNQSCTFLSSCNVYNAS